MYKSIFTLLLLFLSIQSYSQKWDIDKPTGPVKTITINTKEGTWIDLDVSPDGKNIVFDLLGDIYSMPITGGKAKLLASGVAYDVQPRFSPNSNFISFTSDRDGADNIWMMNADGSGKKQITRENFRLLNNAVWTANSQYIIARKHFTASRSLGAGELWMYHMTGGDGIQLTKRKNDQQDLGEPDVSPDGRYVYFSEDVSPGPFFQYNKDPNSEIYAIRRLDLQTGEFEKIAGGPGGAVRPQISPNGKLMAYVKRDRLKSVLMVQDLTTGEEYPVYNDLSHDQQEAWAIFGLYPNFSWLPDNQHIVFYSKGKIHSLDIVNQSVANIPFEVDSKQTITDAVQFDQRVFQNDVDVKMIRQATTSPDGKQIAFNAAGNIYIKDLPDGVPKRLTQDSINNEFEPDYSPDGKYIVYVSWNDEMKGAIQKVELQTGISRAVTLEKGFYYSPKYSSKGNKIIYRKGIGNDVLGYTYGKNAGIYVLSDGNDTAKLVSKEGIKPGFNADDSRIFYQTNQDGKKVFRSMDINGGDKKTHYSSTYATQFAPSPDGKWMAFTELFNAYITPMVNTGNALDLSASNKAIPLTKITRDAGTYLHWSKDSQKLNWTLGGQYFSRDIKNTFSFADGAGKISKPDSTGIYIGLKLPSDLPKGKIAFKNATIITMKGDEVIESGTIIIDENKIIAVGKTAEVSVPGDARVIDASGKTIMPGIIDVHAHLRTSPDGVSPNQDWSYFANLAYGVTTAHDPSSNTEMVFSQAEMIKSGKMTGPRLYSTGTILYGADGDFKAVINSLEDARSSLRRLKAVGAFSVKSYNQPRREQRQQVIQAARELKMEVVPEGGSTFFTNMSMILDGHTGIEHNIPVRPVYKDVTSLWGASKTGYTPTLIVSYGAQSGENYWYDRTMVWENERLLNYVPKSIIDERSRRRTTSEYRDYGHIEVSKAVKKIADAGTKVNLGAHGQLQGLGAHWELWMLQQGGMSPLQAIRCATLNGASYLGMDKEIGSLEKGKLADLIVLNANPLSDIRNSEKISSIMANGRLYDAETMNEIGNYNKPRLNFWWQNTKAESFVQPESEETETFIFTTPECD